MSWIVLTEVESRVYAVLGSRHLVLGDYGGEEADRLEEILSLDEFPEVKVDHILDDCFEGEELAAQAFGDDIKQRLIAALKKTP